MKITVTSFKRSHACTALPSAPKPAAGHCQPTPPPETPGHSRASLGQSLVGSLLLSPGSWCAQGSVWALQTRVYFPVLCKFWQLYGGVNGDLLQEGLCHTQVWCPQSPCSCSSPLLTHTSVGDTQTQFCLSFCRVSGSWCTQGLFEPSEHLWQVWGLILNEISPLLPSCSGLSFALEHGVSPQSCFNAMQSLLQHLPSCWDFSALGSGLSPQSHSSAAQPPLYWSGLPFPSPGDLPNPGIKPRSPTLQAGSLPGEPQCKSLHSFTPSLCSVLDFLKQLSPLIIKSLALNLK